MRDSYNYSLMVDSTHPLYDVFQSTIGLVRDCLGGARRMRANALAYIPKLHKQSDASYSSYIARAIFFNACRRTVQALIGFVFRQNPEAIVGLSPEMKVFMQDATMTGLSFYDYAKQVVGEALSVGRRATFIDWNLPEDRAVIIGYDTEDIRDWRFSRVAGQTVLSMLKLREYTTDSVLIGEYDIDGSDSESIEVEQFRVFELIPDTIGDAPNDSDEPTALYVRMRLYRKDKAARPAATNQGAKAKKATARASDYSIIDEQFLNRGGEPLTRIPVVLHGSEENKIEPDIVPLADIAEINIGHWRNSADYENALHVAGSPTPIAAGFTTDDQKELYLGTKEAWVSEKSDAKAYFLSYNANDASAIKTAMDDKKADMAALGARMLERQGSGGGGQQEAFQTVQIRQAGDMSALMSTTIASTQGLSMVLKWVFWWNNRSVSDPFDIDDKVIHYELNTQFIELAMDAPMLTALVAAFISGALSEEELFGNMQRAGIVSSEKTFKEHKTEVAMSPQALPSIVDPATGRPVDGTGAPATKKPAATGAAAGE